MIDLLTGIQANFQASPGLSAAFANGLELSQAVDAEALPLCVLTVVSAVPSYNTFFDVFIEDVEVTFTIYAAQTMAGGGDMFCAEMAEQIDLAFNRQPMQFDNDLLLIGYRSQTRGPVKADERAWRIDLTYTFTVQANQNYGNEEYGAYGVVD